MLLITITAILGCTAVVVMYGVHVARLGRAEHERLGPSPGSALMPGWLVEAFYWALSAPGRALARLGVEADTLTYAALSLSLASLPLIAAGHFAPAAVLVLAGGALDALDGMVARARGRACPAGAVLDSFVDRLADAAPLVGLAVFFRHHVLTLAIPLTAIVSASLLSYARAKADTYQLKLPNGLMRRHERIVYLVISLLLAPVAPRAPSPFDVPYPATLAGVLVIAVGSFVAACILVARTRAALRETEAPPAAEQPEARPASLPWS
jgi:CDP-diacylglycerol---glycerol-3-phosphate 3-phosphatidyltransferase